MSSSPRTSSLRPSISPQEGRDVRARAWAFVFDCYRKKKAATSSVSRPDDGTTRIQGDDSANGILPH
jgi:hypothetical protein